MVVLVRARNPNNIGAVARAMHDFGFRHLRVVSEYAPPLETARSAVDASEVLSEAKSFESVTEAVADCTLVVGTTAVESVPCSIVSMPWLKLAERFAVRQSVPTRGSRSCSARRRRD